MLWMMLRCLWHGWRWERVAPLAVRHGGESNAASSQCAANVRSNGSKLIIKPHIYSWRRYGRLLRRGSRPSGA